MAVDDVILQLGCFDLTSVDFTKIKSNQPNNPDPVFVV